LPDQTGPVRKREQRRDLSAQISGFMGSAAAAQDGLLLPARRLPPGRQQIRKTCGVPAYFRVVIEKHRTQASRTMNAETAQAGTERVN
jgi:hypothetical protein